MSLNRLLPALCVLVFSAVPGISACLANPPTTSKPLVTPLEAEAEFGFIQTSGNTQSVSIHARLKLEQEAYGWRNLAQLTGFHTRSENQSTGEQYTSANKYTVKLRGERDLIRSRNLYTYVMTDYEHNRFSGFTFQTGVNGGLGYLFINEEKIRFALESGPGFRYDKVTYESAKGDPILRIGETFHWVISPMAELNQTLDGEFGKRYTISRFTLDLQSTLTERLSLKLGTELKYTNRVPSRRKHADQTSFASIAYRF